MNPMTKSFAATLIGLFLLCNAAYSQTGSLPSDTNVPMKSRTCGLVLMSDGRAAVRAGDMEKGMAELVSAFALLQDGRALEDKAAARTLSQQLLENTSTRSTAISSCKQWMEKRKTQPDFAKSEADQWNWVNQAQLTIQTEK